MRRKTALSVAGSTSLSGHSLNGSDLFVHLNTDCFRHTTKPLRRNSGCVRKTRSERCGRSTQYSFRPHRSTTYVNAAYCYRPSSVVCLCVCHTSEPCKNGCTDRHTIWVGDSCGLKEPCIGWGPDSHMGRGNFEGKRASYCKV